ncbi:MAG: LPS export ABC transporter permease LptF [Gammaproteobacteria bacterium]
MSVAKTPWARSSLLNRYLLREVGQTWLAVTLVLLLILVTNQFAAVLGDAAASQIPRDAIVRVMGLTIVQYLTILVPLSFFLAIMLSLARLYHDSEMSAMMACGIGPAQLYRPLLMLGLLLAVGVAWLSLVASPAAVREVKTLSEVARRDASLGLLEPGRFISFGSSGAVMYAESLTGDQHLHNVFVQRRVGERVEVILADEAWQVVTDNGNFREVVFARGRRYEGEPGGAKFRIVEFVEHGIPFAVPVARNTALKANQRTTSALLESSDPVDRAELHWRLAPALTLLVLTVIAVPLAKTEPRRGRFSGLAAAILVYVIYANLLAAGQAWLERERLPEFSGLWWVHGLFLLVAGLMLLVQRGLFRKLQRRWQLGGERP